jgi:D-arabinose 1-dehydrogenase-like Zn-dependent alcohol dehydrogenase
MTLTRCSFLELMNPHSHIICAGLTTDDLVVPFFPLMLKQISIHPTLTATPDEVEAMLKFAAENNVHPIVQEFPMTQKGVTNAFDKLQSGKMRYRGILVA